MPFGVPKENGTVPAATGSRRKACHHSEEAGNRSSVGARHEQTSKPSDMLACRQDCIAVCQHFAWKICCSAYALTCRRLDLLAWFSATMPPRLHARETASRLAGQCAFLPDGRLAFLLACLLVIMPTACPAGPLFCHRAAELSRQDAGQPPCRSACFPAAMPACFPAGLSAGLLVGMAAGRT